MPSEINSNSLEQMARTLGESWAKRLLVQREGGGKTSDNWPCRLDEARRLIDESVGCKMSVERIEALAIIAERSARAAWKESSLRR